MIARVHHLHDDRLFDCYLAHRTGDTLDPRLAEHLLDCAHCTSRYGELTQLMDEMRLDAEAETDAIFTPERLRQQRQQIVRRLEQVGRRARVISFPARVGRQVAGATQLVAPRWLAAAAAAGLFVGVAVSGLFFQAVRLESEPMIMARSKPVRPPVAPPPVRVTSPASVQEPADDDRFLSDLENALRRPRTRELLPFDALTPHVRDIKTQLR